MSSPNEIRILRIVRELGSPTKRAAAGAMEISEDYAGYLLRELADRGFLEKASGRFHISEKGIDELFAVLYHVQGRLRAKMYRAARQESRLEKKLEELKGGKIEPTPGEEYDRSGTAGAEGHKGTEDS